MIREILASVKLGGGGQPESNPRLRQAIASARAVNMPSDTIQISQAIKKFLCKSLVRFLSSNNKFDAELNF